MLNLFDHRPLTPLFFGPASGLTKSISRLTSSPLRTSRSFAKTVGKAAAKAGKMMGKSAEAVLTPEKVGGGQGKPSVSIRSSTKKRVSAGLTVSLSRHDDTDRQNVR
jgi:hypothetical protein